MRYLYIILYLLALVVIGATADGLNNSGSQLWGHIVEPLEILGLFMLLKTFNLFTWRGAWLALLSYAFIRAGLFDHVRNLVAGQEFFYFGGNNIWDKFFVMMPPFGVASFKIIFLITGIAIPFRERL